MSVLKISQRTVGERIAYAEGALSACDAFELHYGRMVEKLWPEEVDAVEAIRSVREVFRVVLEQARTDEEAKP